LVTVQNNKRRKGKLYVSKCQGLENIKVEMMGLRKECVYMERRVTIRKAAGGGLRAEDKKYIQNKQTL
jgi:hypothetical protein